MHSSGYRLLGIGKGGGDFFPLILHVCLSLYGTLKYAIGKFVKLPPHTHKPI